jgi:hypothetical protein
VGLNTRKVYQTRLINRRPLNPAQGQSIEIDAKLGCNYHGGTAVAPVRE